MRLGALLALLWLVVACGGNRPSATESSSSNEVDTAVSDDSVARAMALVQYDSAIAAMQVRYDRLCLERREAYAITDSAMRSQQLERNDVVCRELSDSLQRIIARREAIEQ